MSFHFYLWLQPPDSLVKARSPYVIGHNLGSVIIAEPIKLRNRIDQILPCHYDTETDSFFTFLWRYAVFPAEFQQPYKILPPPSTISSHSFTQICAVQQSTC